MYQYLKYHISAEIACAAWAFYYQHCLLVGVLYFILRFHHTPLLFYKASNLTRGSLNLYFLSNNITHSYLLNVLV